MTVMGILDKSKGKFVSLLLKGGHRADGRIVRIGDEVVSLDHDLLGGEKLITWVNIKQIQGICSRL